MSGNDGKSGEVNDEWSAVEVSAVAAGLVMNGLQSEWNENAGAQFLPQHTQYVQRPC